MKEERCVKEVLCVARKDLPPEWLSESTAVLMNAQEFLDQTADLASYWLPRSEAETQPQWKELIPYIVVRADDGSKMACYRRNGTEKRLRDFWSVGIGGHVNPDDTLGSAVGLAEAVTQAAMRELTEELGVTGVELQFLGIINEELTPVGTVHLGLVFSITINPEEITKPSEELVDFRWTEIQHVKHLRLERWSRMALNLFAE